MGSRSKGHEGRRVIRLFERKSAKNATKTRQQELELELERIRQDYFKLEETVHSLMPYRNQAEILDKRLTQLYHSIDQERAEHQAIIDNLTSENDQLRLELNRLHSHCAKCSLCTLHSPIGQARDGTEDLSVVERLTDNFADQQPPTMSFHILGSASADVDQQSSLPEGTDAFHVSVPEPGSATEVHGPVPTDVPATSSGESVCMAIAGVHLQRTAGFHDQEMPKNQLPKSPQKLGETPPDRVAWLLGDDGSEPSKSAEFLLQSANSLPTSDSRVSGNLARPILVRTEVEPDDVELVAQLVGARSPLANLPMETDVDELIDLLRVSPTSSRPISHTSTISINDILDDDSDLEANEGDVDLSLFNLADDKELRAVGDDTARKPYAESFGFDFEFGTDRTNKDIAQRMTTLESGFQLEDKTNKEHVHTETTISSESPELSDHVEVPPDSSLVIINPLQDSGHYSDQDDIQGQAVEELKENQIDFSREYAHSKVPPQSSNVVTEENDQTENSDVTTVNALDISTSNASANETDVNISSDSACLQEQQLDLDAEDKETFTESKAVAQQSERDDRKSKRFDLTSRGRALPPQLSKDSAPQSKLQPAGRRKSLEWIIGDEVLPKTSQVDVGKDKVTALTVYFEEVHADQCPGCTVCLTGNVERPFQIKRRSSLPVSTGTGFTSVDGTAVGRDRENFVGLQLQKVEPFLEPPSCDSPNKAAPAPESVSHYDPTSNFLATTAGHDRRDPVELPASESSAELIHDSSGKDSRDEPTVAHEQVSNAVPVKSSNFSSASLDRASHKELKQDDTSGFRTSFPNVAVHEGEPDSVLQTGNAPPPATSRRVVSLPDMSGGSVAKSQSPADGGKPRTQFRFRLARVRSHSLRSFTDLAAASGTAKRPTTFTQAKPVATHGPFQPQQGDQYIHKSEPVSELFSSAETQQVSSERLKSTTEATDVAEVVKPSGPVSLDDLFAEILAPASSKKERASSLTPGMIRKYRIEPRRRLPPPAAPPRRESRTQTFDVGDVRLEQRIDSMLIDAEKKWSDDEWQIPQRRNIPRTTAVPVPASAAELAAAYSAQHAVPASRGRPAHLSVKPPRPRPPLKYCLSPRSVEDEPYDNMAAPIPRFSFPVARPHLQPSSSEWISTQLQEPSLQIDRSPPSFQRWVRPSRQQPGSKVDPFRHAVGPVYSSPDERLSYRGDLSVCIGLTVQCSPMGVYTSTPCYASNTRGPAMSPYGAGNTNQSAVVPWPSSRQTRLVPVRSCEDPPDYQRLRGSGGSGQVSAQDLLRYRMHHRRSHPPAEAVIQPQRALGSDFRTPYTPSNLSPANWEGQPMRGRRNSFEDVAVGFEKEMTADVVRGQAGFVVDEEEDTAFDEITQQIASLTDTVNELRFKHRRPFVSQGEDLIQPRRSGGGIRKPR